MAVDGTRSPATGLPALLLRERAAVWAALIGVSALAWLYLWMLARRMAAMPGMDMGGMKMADMPGMAMSATPHPWSGADFALTFAMWWVMMVGMMLPSAAPMILTFAAVNRAKRARGQPWVPTSVFAAAYLAAWGGFGLAATAAQWGLERAAMMSPAMETTSPVFGGALFLAAGAWQLTPLKAVCLRHCRSPFDFLLNRWREGTRGALAMGLEHGFYCLGCCWILMALLFVGGVMNLLWVAAIAAFVLAEKVFPGGQWIARASGAMMLGFGAWLIATA